MFELNAGAINDYRKKPVVISAVQYTGENLQIVQEWLKDDLIEKQEGLYIKTLEGDFILQLNDYIIKGIQGEFYPCKPDIFTATYEMVDW